MEVYRDTIEGFSGSWMSGIGFITFQSGASVPCENGSRLGAALDDLATNVRGVSAIASGHCIDSSAIRGIEVIYFYDEFGLTLGGFIHYDEWLDKTGLELPVGVRCVVDEIDGEVVLVESDGVTIET